MNVKPSSLDCISKPSTFSLPRVSHKKKKYTGMLSDTIQLLFTDVDESYSSINRTQSYHVIFEDILVEFIKRREISRLHSTRRGCRNQVENVTRIEGSILLRFIAVPRHKYNDDEYNGHQRCDGRRDKSTNNCCVRLVEAVRMGRVGAGCRDSHTWWDDAGASRIQTILILRVQGTYELGTEKKKKYQNVFEKGKKSSYAYGTT